MNNRRGTMSNGHDRKAGLVETMRMTADSFQLAAYSPDKGEIGVVEGAASGPRLAASGERRMSGEWGMAGRSKPGDRLESEKTGGKA
jgi:hypothetical protein